jgi:hypothetical protein
MFERFTRNTVVASGAALLAALGVGTAAIAQSNGSQPTNAQPAQSQAKEVPGQESNAPENSATDKDNVQYTAPGDPDYKGTSGASASSAKATAAGSTQAEQPGSESSSETAPDSDGPGGHADEPGNPNADHQFQGQE